MIESSGYNTTVGRKGSFISNAHYRSENQTMSTSMHFPNLESIARNGFRDNIPFIIYLFCFKIRIYNYHIITMVLKSKTFAIFYNLYPLKSKPLRHASVFKQRSDDATSLFCLPMKTVAFFTQVVMFEIPYLKIYFT